MARHSSPGRLLARLPAVRGSYEEAVSLADMTWFRVGGVAEVLYRPADVEDLAEFLEAWPSDIPLTVIGVGSNLLVRDGGLPGVVVRLGRAFARIETAGAEVVAGAAAPDMAIALAARDAGIGGLEFLRGVPGTLGGALRMNAGAYGREIADVLVCVEALDARGEMHRALAGDLDLSYRHSSAPADWIFVRARLRGRAEARDVVAERMARVKEAREASQPTRARTGGSTFKNPPGAKAWELIDAAGCRGLRHGGARVSEQHCNFLINEGGASAQDLETLGEEVRCRVLEATGLLLEWEIRRLGVPAEAETGEVPS